MKKRIFALALSLMMTLACLPLSTMAAPSTTKEEHKHNYIFTINRTQHFYACNICGQRKDVFNHDDPLTAKDGKCVCGYTYSNNTDITLIWLDGVRLTQKATAGVTEYEGTTVSYKDVTKTRFNVKAFDGKAKIELPEDLTIKEGSNQFKFTVTAEDGKTTETYTVTVVKG